MRSSRLEVLVAWTKLWAVEVVRSDQDLNVLWRQSQQNMLRDWLCDVREREELGIALKFLASATGSIVLPSPEDIKLCGYVWAGKTESQLQTSGV